MKRILSMLLCAAMLISFVPAAWAEGGDGQELIAEQPVEEQTEQPVEEPYIPPVEEPSAPEEPEITEPPVVEPTAEPEPTVEPAPTAEPEATPGIALVCVRFITTPAELTVFVYSAGETVLPNEDGIYTLAPGEYTYTAECEGYETLLDVPFTVTGEAEYAEIEVVLTAEDDGIAMYSDDVIDTEEKLRAALANAPGDGTYYGVTLAASITLTQDLTIPHGYRVSVRDGANLTVSSGVTLDVYGSGLSVTANSTIMVESGATINLHMVEIEEDSYYDSTVDVLGGVFCNYGTVNKIIPEYVTAIEKVSLGWDNVCTGEYTDYVTGIDRSEIRVQANPKSQSDIQQLLTKGFASYHFNLRNELTLTENMEIPSNVYIAFFDNTLTLAENVTVTIASGGYLFMGTNTTLHIKPGASVVENGTLTVDGTLIDENDSGGDDSGVIDTEEKLRAAIDKFNAGEYQGSTAVEGDIVLTKDLTVPYGFRLSLISGCFTVPAGVTLNTYEAIGVYSSMGPAVIAVENGGQIKLLSTAIDQPSESVSYYYPNITVTGGRLVNNGVISGEAGVRAPSVVLQLVEDTDYSTVVTGVPNNEMQLCIFEATQSDIKRYMAEGFLWYTFYGDVLTLTEDMEIPDGIFVMFGGNTVLVSKGVTLTNNGTMQISNGCTLYLKKGADFVDNGFTINDGKILREENAVKSGVGTDGLAWEISDDGVLTISGSGPMADYGWFGDEAAPWREYYFDILSVVIEEGVTSIGNMAFYGCTRLTQPVEIPDSVTGIGEEAFRECKALTGVKIGSGVSSIPRGCFWDCHALADVQLPAGLSLIGDGAFRECTSLENIILPDGLTEIGANAFGGCTALTGIAIPSSVTKIDSLAFSLCTALSGTVTLPAALEDIGYNIFAYAPVDVYYNGSLESLAALYENGTSTQPPAPVPFGFTFGGSCVLHTTDGTYYSVGPVYRLTDNIKQTGQVLYNGTPVARFTLNEGGLLTVGGSGEVAIPDFGTDTDTPPRVTQVSFADGISYLSRWLQLGSFTNMRQVYIPASVTVIDAAIFQNSTQLEEVYYGGSAEQWKAISIGGDNAPLLSARMHYGAGGEELGAICVSEINISGSVSIGANTTAQYTAEVSPADAWDKSFTWSVIPGTGDASIDENGLLTATAAGTVTVRATANDENHFTGELDVTIVERAITVTGAEKLAGGKSAVLSAAYIPAELNGTVKWSLAAGDDEYVTVKAGKNNTVIVTAKAVTEAHDVTVIASDAAGNVADTQHVITVIPAATGVNISLDGENVTGKTRVINLNAETELTLNASAAPAGAEGNIVWTSSDAKGTFGAYVDNGDGTLNIILSPAAKLTTITLTATDTVSRKKAIFKLTTTRVSTGLEIEGYPTESGALVLENALSGGQSVQLKARVLGSPKATAVTWSLPAEYEPYATLTAAGKLTVKAATEAREIMVIAKAKDGGSESRAYIWTVPKTNALVLLINGEALSGTAYNIDLSGGADALTIGAVTYPADAKTALVWTVSDAKNVYAEYDVSANGVSISGFKGKTGSVTVTAKATDGSNKTARVTLKFVRYANSIEILNAPEAITGGKSVALKTNVQTDKTLTDKAVVWSVSAASAPYASINASGSLKAQPTAVEVPVEVIATVKATGVSTSKIIRVQPNLSRSVDVLMNGSVVNGQTVKVTLNDAVSVSARVQPSDEAVIWKSSSTAIAAVGSDGTVVLNKAGTVTLTATTADGKTKGSFKLTAVMKPDYVMVTGYSEVKGGSKTNLGAFFYPSKPANSRVIWSIDPADASYGSISSSGVFTAAKVTTKRLVTLTCTSVEFPDLTAKRTMTIVPVASSLNVEYDGPTVIDVDDNAGEIIWLNAKCYPEEAMQTVMWKSSNTNVATVSAIGGVKLTGKTGAVTFTASTIDGSRKSVSVKLTITRNMDTLLISGADMVAGGKSVTYKAVCDQNATNKKVIWSLSGDTDYATLSASGALKAKAVTAPKYVTVTATAADGGGATASMDVVIYPIVTKINIVNGSETVTGKTLTAGMSTLDTLALKAENVPARSYKGWTVTSSNKAVTAAIDASGNISVSLVSGAAIKANTVVTITVKAADGSNKTANVKLKLT